MIHLALALGVALLVIAAVRARGLARAESEQRAALDGAQLWARVSALAEREEYRPPRLSEIRRPRATLRLRGGRR